MAKSAQKDVFLSTDVVVGLVTFLQNAATKNKLKGREKNLAGAYAQLLQEKLKTKEERARISLSLEVIGNILRIILTLLVPDPAIRVLIELFSRMK